MRTDSNDNINSHTSPHGRLNSHPVSHEIPWIWKSSRTKGWPRASGARASRLQARPRGCPRSFAAAPAFWDFYYFLAIFLLFFPRTYPNPTCLILREGSPALVSLAALGTLAEGLAVSGTFAPDPSQTAQVPVCPVPGALSSPHPFDQCSISLLCMKSVFFLPRQLQKKFERNIILARKKKSDEGP